MRRSQYVLWLAVASIFACDSHPTAPPRQRAPEPAGVASARPERSVRTTSATTIVSFGAMYGVEEGFLNHKFIRDVLGDELPWEVGSANGSLTTDGHLTIHVRGLVFADVPEVPPELRGKNDEEQFRGLVSCLVPREHGAPQTVNITTRGFPATPAGDSDIDAFVQLPDDCVAPIIFVLAGSEDKWFSVMGAEIGG
jgi:hypothetical protein